MIADNNSDSLPVTDDKDKSKLFNRYFCSQSIADDTNANLPSSIHNGPAAPLSSVTISSQDVKDVLQIINTNKATGPDGINPTLLKQASSVLADPLSKLFNLSLQQSTFPEKWKTANVIPVYKKGSKELVSNYRPISLLSVLGKTMERCVFKHVYNFIHENNILTPQQSGFRPNDSTVNQLLSITSDFYKAIDEGKEIRAVFFDISKAFDKVWHNGLLFKLEKIGITGCLLNWFRSYLTRRKQSVVINGAKSDEA
jgi:hypothetical protein